MKKALLLMIVFSAVWSITHTQSVGIGTATPDATVQLVAQELEVSLKRIGFDFSGLHVPQAHEDNYSIAYDNFVPILIKAIQEDASNKELKSQLQLLQQQVNSQLKAKQ